MAACLGVVAPALCANTVTVTRCDDNNIAGDLRHGVAAAMDGDTVDVTACANSTISLSLGALATSHDITLLGPGKDQLLISGKYDGMNPILIHMGSGTLTIKNVTLGGGYAFASGSGIPPPVAAGGCIYSSGSVSLDHADVVACTAYVYGNGLAFGGGIIAAQDLSLTYSMIAGNMAKGTSKVPSAAGGGGAVVGRDFSADHSSVLGNYATASLIAYGGGLMVNRNATITSSTIASNVSSDLAGGVFIKNSYGSVQITNSTISDNTAMTDAVGGIFLGAAATTIRNTTIAFNHAAAGGAGVYAPGLTLAVPSDSTSSSVNLQSTLVANNTYGASPIENDISAKNGTSSFVSVIGSSNLVPVATVSLPGGTITGACPLLGPLRDNGGPTWTRALLSHSRGIDEGNNSAALANDQRGPPYARVSGGVADIGAYEVQKDEIVFDAGFDGCP